MSISIGSLFFFAGCEDSAPSPEDGLEIEAGVLDPLSQPLSQPSQNSQIQQGQIPTQIVAIPKTPLGQLPPDVPEAKVIGSAISPSLEFTLEISSINAGDVVELFTGGACEGTPLITKIVKRAPLSVPVVVLVEGVHEFSLRATSMSGKASKCSVSVVYSVDQTPPLSPETLSHAEFISDNTKSPFLTWSNSLSADVAEYSIGIGTNVDPVSVLDWTVLGEVPYQASGLNLAECTETYYYSVRATDKAGLVSETPAKSVNGFRYDLTPPTAPSALVQMGDASEAAGETTQWLAAADNCGVAGYQMAISETADLLSIVEGGSWTTTGSSLEGRIGSGLSLESFKTYFTLVRAIDGAGIPGPYSVTGSWMIPGPPFGVSNLTIGARNTNSIEIAWTQPGDNGNPITDYLIEYRISLSTPWLSYTDGVNTTLNTTVSGLVANKSYDFRVRAYNGTTGDFSNVAVGETLLDIPIFEPNVFKAMNIGGATDSSVVAFEDETILKVEGVEYPMNAGDTHTFISVLNQVVEADKPIFVAGRKGASGASANLKGNMVWSTKDWSGKEFLFTGTRDAPHIVTVYAFEDSEITIYQGANPVAGATATLDVSVDPKATFSLSGDGAFRIESTGLIVAYMYSNLSSHITDPKPLIPIAKDIVGFPSTVAKVSSLTASNAYTVYHSDGSSSSGTLNAGTDRTLSPKGTSSLFQSHSSRIVAVDEITANSNADSNGYCSAPFLPISLMRKRYAINVNSDFVAFASLEAGDITVTQPDGTISTLSFQQSGAEPNAPYYARIGTMPAGTRFASEVRMGAWYQPNSDSFGGDEDETIMFGYD